MSGTPLTPADEDLLRRFAPGSLRWIAWWVLRHVTAQDPACASGAVKTLCDQEIPVVELAPESPEYQRLECRACWHAFVVISTGRAPHTWNNRSPYPPGR